MRANPSTTLKATHHNRAVLTNNFIASLVPLQISYIKDDWNFKRRITAHFYMHYNKLIR